VEFPRLYEVEGAEIDVTVGEAFFRAEEENKRIVDNGWLKVQRGYDSWVMDLRVYNPLYGHRYAVAYKPPTRDSLKPSSGFKRPADPD